MARVFLETGRLPHEILSLGRGEKALVYAAVITQGKFKGNSTQAIPRNLRTVQNLVRAAKGV